MKYIIIGNGVAGTTAALKIRNHDSEGKITMLTDEATPFYSRIRLIEYLAGDAGKKDIIIYKDDWYQKNNIQLLLNTPVNEVNADKKTIIVSGGETLEYDRLLLATGGISFVPPLPGSDRQGVFTLRSIQDADEIIKYVKGRKDVILIGGGVLGLEAGNSLRKRGHNITVVEFFPRLLPRQMDPEGAEILKARMEGMGFQFHLGAKSKEIVGDEQACGLVLEDGTRIDGDVVVISAGVRPQAGLAKTLGLTVNKGLMVNDRMETEIKDIYAAGDVIEHRERFYGIWPAAQKQGEIAGINMAGGDTAYAGTTVSNVLKVVGIDLSAAGDIDADGTSECFISKDAEKNIYRKLVLHDNILTGCIFFGDIKGYRRVLKAIEEKRDIRGIKNDLEKWDFGGL